VSHYRRRRLVLLLFGILLALVILPCPVGATSESGKHLIYDEAHLLTQEQSDELNALAIRYGAKRDTDFIIYTTDNPLNLDVVSLTESFYDEKKLGYDRPHGNAAILTMDMRNREIYLAGFYKAKDYLDDARMDRIRSRITPDLTAGDYTKAFETYITTSYRYMGIKPGVNPDNLLFKGWFQLALSVIIGAVVVVIMGYRSGGRVTVNRMTYEDSATSGVVAHEDLYTHTTTTKRKIERSSSSSSGGGGGTTGGGHSHSGSRGSF
jgi:uncharacterized protein